MGNMQNKKKTGWLVILGLLFLPLTLLILPGVWIYRVTKRQLAEDPERVWYKRTWGILLLLAVFFPVGVYLLWRYGKFGKKGKIISTAVFGLFAVIGAAANTADTPPDDRSGSSAPITTEAVQTTETFAVTTASTTTTETTTVTETTTTTTETTTTTMETTTETATTETTTTEATATVVVIAAEPETTTEVQTEVVNVVMVWIPQEGERYHSHSGCSGMNNPSHVPLPDAVNWGYTPCKRCY